MGWGPPKNAMGFYQIEGIKRDLQLQAECATFNLEAHGVPVRRLNDWASPVMREEDISVTETEQQTLGAADYWSKAPWTWERSIGSNDNNIPTTTKKNSNLSVSSWRVYESRKQTTEIRNIENRIRQGVGMDLCVESEAGVEVRRQDKTTCQRVPDIHTQHADPPQFPVISYPHPST